MKMICLGAPRVIMSNPESLHDYFAWPTVARLQSGAIAVVASGYRLRHVCPFGKAVISYSMDEGETFSAPAPVIDTVLDDRDAGIAAFGKKGVIVTSFNNTTAFQRRWLNGDTSAQAAYCMAYLDTVPAEKEQAALGSQFRLSDDGGVTFGALHRSPITSPHGPTVLADGSLLWVGRTFTCDDSYLGSDRDRIEAYTVHPDGRMTYVGRIENIEENGRRLLSCEPHTLALADGTLLCHIRVQQIAGDPVFTTYQARSADGGKTWTKPVRLLEVTGGAPAHLFQSTDGTLFSVYGYRNAPFGIRVMYSLDGGESWSTDHVLYENTVSGDLGYPATVELADGTFLTVFYAHPAPGAPAVILAQKWQAEL